MAIKNNTLFKTKGKLEKFWIQGRFENCVTASRGCREKTFSPSIVELYEFSALQAV